MNPTPIETMLARQKDRDARRKHDAAFLATRAQGADFHCATMVGFSATDEPPSVPILCESCIRKGVRP